MSLQEELDRVRQFKDAGDLQQALATLLPLLESEPTKPEPQRLAGELYEQLGEPALARNHFESMLAINPNAIPAMMGLGRLERVNDQAESALRRFERVRELNPEHIGALRNQAGTLLSLLRYDEADAVLQFACTHHPADIILQRHQVELMIGRKEYIRAETALSKLLASHNDNVQLWQLLFRALREQKKFRTWMHATETAYQQLSDKPPIAAEHIANLQRFGRYEEALACAAATDEKLFRSAHYLSVWGELMLSLGKTELLANQLNTPSADSAPPLVSFNKLQLKAALEMRAGDYMAAAQYLQRALELNPAHNRVHERLIECSILALQLDTAHQQLAASPLPPWTHQYLFNEAVLFPEAIAALRTALHSNPAGHEQLRAASTVVAQTPQSLLSTQLWLQQLARALHCFHRSETSETIPARVFQYWHEALPSDLLTTTASWKQNSSFEEYHLITNDEAFQRLHTHDPTFDRATFETLEPTLRADLLRLILLYEEGGIWANVDCQLRNPFPDGCFTGYELVLLLDDKGAVSTQFMAAVAGHPIIKDALEEALEAALTLPEKPHHQTSGSSAITIACARQWAAQVLEHDELKGAALYLVPEMKSYVSFSIPHEYQRHRSMPFQFRSRLPSRAVRNG